MGLTVIGKYLVGVILVIAGLILMVQGNTNMGVTIILLGLGYLGLAKDTEDIKQSIQAFKK